MAVSTGTQGDFLAPAASIVVDKLPAYALLRAGVRATKLVAGRFDVALHVENALGARYVSPDPVFEKRQSIFSMEGPGRSAMLSLTGRL